MNGLIKKLLSSNNFLSLANNGLVAVFGFLSFIMLVRMVSQEVFGEWVLFLTAGGFIDMLRFGITRTAIIRFLSGANEIDSQKLMGSNNLINFISTAIIAIVLILIYHFFKNIIDDSGFAMFFKWYPVLSFFNLPFNNAQSILQAKMKFDKMLWLRMINVGTFMIFLGINMFMAYDIEIILYVYLFTNLISSLLASFSNWDGIRYTFQANWKTNLIILDFGKYTTGTLIGSNLLKSSDAFIIGLSPFMGPVGVALYSIPLKLTEIIEIPLRSFAATAFPNMSRAAIDKDYIKVKEIFYQNAGGMTFLMIPVMLFSFIFAEQIVYILGGKDYLVTANIFRIFCIYGLLLPIDRFIGIGLDSVNKPKQNFFKVIYMASANIFGDILAVFGVSTIIIGISWVILVSQGYLPDVAYRLAHGFTLVKTLELVAGVTILFTIIGILVGYYYLNKELQLNKRAIFVIGFKTIINLIKSRRKTL
ncbi:MAG: oligosaccharide flippase family protein [Bacteroidales bacterium]|nr:oligosaccharide flippase family protein [Bacteroidales bacterium]